MNLLGSLNSYAHTASSTTIDAVAASPTGGYTQSTSSYSFGGSSYTTMFVFQSNGTFSVPIAYPNAVILVVGGGGGGGGNNGINEASGAGGGGGVIVGTIAITENQTYNIVVGSGGSRGTNTSVIPTNGGNSSLYQRSDQQ